MKKFYILTLLTSAVFVAACSVPSATDIPTKESQGANAVDAPTEPEEAVLQEDTDAAAQAQTSVAVNEYTALATKIVADCFRAQNCFLQSVCFAEVAKSQRDVNICSLHVRDCEGLEMVESMRDFTVSSCEGDVTMAMVKDVARQNDTAACQQLTGTTLWFNNEILQKDMCLFQVAGLRSDPAICNMITTTAVIDSIGRTLLDNCLLFAEPDEEDVDDSAANPFRDFYEFMPRDLKECMEQELGEQFHPAYNGTFVSPKLMDAFDVCSAPMAGENEVHVLMRLVPDIEPCLQGILGDARVSEVLSVHDDYYILKTAEKEAVDSCPLVQTMNNLGAALAVYAGK